MQFDYLYFAIKQGIGIFKVMKKGNDSIWEVIKVLLLIYIIGNLVFTVIMYFLDDMTYVKEGWIETGISVAFGIFLVSAIELLQRIEYKKCEKKSKEIFQDNTEYKLLRCSGAYFQIPIITILIDMMFIFMLWQEFGENLYMYIEAMQKEEMLVPIITISFFNFYSVFVILYYCCYKVFYTRYDIYVVHFLKKTNISWGEIKKVSYFSKKQKLIIETKQERLILCFEDLGEGWDAFISYVFENACERNIGIDYISKDR